jgi:DNA/RNA-binding domain of Phe-tRNA-synthetase-like protein
MRLRSSTKLPGETRVSWKIVIAPELRSRVSLGVLASTGLRVARTTSEQDDEITAHCRIVAERFAGRSSGQVPGVEDARRLYRALGLDPTKTRPSSEALLRRVLKGQSLHRVNALVDAVNLCSLTHQLPYGVYDSARVAGPLVFRLGAAGEGYEGIRKGRVNVAARPVLSDAHGPFGNPTSDSERTMITNETSAALIVVYAPTAMGSARLESVLDATAAAVLRFCGGTVVQRTVV